MLPSAQQVSIIAGCLLLASALGARLAAYGPYLERPATVIDHVGPNRHEIADALTVLPIFASQIPHGATVACFKPVNGLPNEDINFLTAVGQLPRQQLVPAFTITIITPPDDLPEYVVAIRERFDDQRYQVIAERPEGRLYRVIR